MPKPDAAMNRIMLDAMNVQTRLKAAQDYDPDDPGSVARRNELLRACRSILRNAASTLSVILDDLSDEDAQGTTAVSDACRSFADRSPTFVAVLLLGLLPEGGADVRKVAPDVQTGERLFGQLAKRLMAEAGS